MVNRDFCNIFFIILLFLIQTHSFANNWMGIDINTSIPGSTFVNPNGVFVINGAGEDIWDKKDSFYFLYKKGRENFELICRVLAMKVRWLMVSSRKRFCG